MALSGNNGDQKLRPNVSSNRTADALVSPVTNQELADFLGVAVTDPLLPGLLLSATQAFIDFANMELLARTYTLKIDRYPDSQPGFSGLASMSATLAPWIDLPIYPAASIASVEIDGEAVTYESDLASRPARVAPEIARGIVEIVYDAGFAAAGDIPADIKTGIMLMAAYLYEHRGACTTADAVAESGAYGMWRRHRMWIGGL